MGFDPARPRKLWMWTGRYIADPNRPGERMPQLVQIPNEITINRANEEVDAYHHYKKWRTPAWYTLDEAKAMHPKDFATDELWDEWTGANIDINKVFSFECELCDFKIHVSNRDDIAGHIQFIHGGQELYDKKVQEKNLAETYVCPTCNWVPDRKGKSIPDIVNQINMHIETHKPDEPVENEVNDETTTRRGPGRPPKS